MKLETMDNEFLREQIQSLKQYVQHAYAPYSNFKVACLLTDEKEVLMKGVNMENASYGLSMCAERNAIAAALAMGVDLNRVKTIIIYNENKLIGPCGACAQVICEMLNSEVNVIMANHEEYEVCKGSQLLPFAFDKEDLK